MQSKVFQKLICIRYIGPFTIYILSISMSKKRESQEIFVNVVVQTLRMRYGTDVKRLSESTPTLRKNSLDLPISA